MPDERTAGFINEREQLLEANRRLYTALKECVFALDGVVDGDLVATGKTVRSALSTGVAALRPPAPPEQFMQAARKSGHTFKSDRTI